MPVVYVELSIPFEMYFKVPESCQSYFLPGPFMKKRHSKHFRKGILWHLTRTRTYIGVVFYFQEVKPSAKGSRSKMTLQ